MKDPNCIFCKIVAGEIPAEKVYEDAGFLAFMDIRPLSPGHALVIPKEHYRWVWDLPAGRQVSPNIGEYFEVVRKIALAQKKVFNIDMVRCQIVGEEVPHAHIWVIPDPKTTRGDKKDFKGNKEKIIEALINIK
ncbi:MAG: HIT domain-containing protein [Candidatus Paceibacterota bacterium]|jgi:histidine triad (HIT) family protein